MVFDREIETGGVHWRKAIFFSNEKEIEKDKKKIFRYL